MTPLSTVQLHAIMPKADAPKWVLALSAAMAEYDITTPARAAAFLAQLAHESVELTHVEENLNYSATGLLKVFPKRVTPEQAVTLARNPEAIANHVYGNRKDLGNTEPGDGWRYRGRGPIQLTGKANYAKAAEALEAPLVENPDAVTAPLVGARVAGWYWQSHGLNELADAGDFTGITKRINGGVLGLAERQAYHRRALLALG